MNSAKLICKDNASPLQYIKIVSHRHFILKCLYQSTRVSAM